MWKCYSDFGLRLLFLYISETGTIVTSDTAASCNTDRDHTVHFVKIIDIEVFSKNKMTWVIKVGAIQMIFRQINGQINVKKEKKNVIYIYPFDST